MGNVITLPAAASKSFSADDHKRRHEISSSFHGTHCLSVGYSTKDISNSDSVFRTPTPKSRGFSIPSNPSTFRSSESLSPSSENGPHQRRWVCTKVGLGMINSLANENEESDEVLKSPKSKNIILGPQLKINFPTASSSSHFYKFLNSSVEAKNPPSNKISPHLGCGSNVVSKLGEASVLAEHTHVQFDEPFSCLVDSIRISFSSRDSFSSVSTNNGTNHTIPDSFISLSDDQMENPSVKTPSFISTTNGTSHTIPDQPLSLSEIENSEEYTCIISHGPDQKIVHIFGDSIVECHPNEKKKLVCQSSQMANHPHSSTSYPFDDEFLILCYTCKRRLGKDTDIYIYRGDRSFCSDECRFEGILAEKMQRSVGKSSKSNSNPSNHEIVFLI